MHEKSKPTTTVNISNSTVGNVNLGNVIGDLNGSILDLNTTGSTGLADGFKRMTEAIIASKELDGEAQKELL